MMAVTSRIRRQGGAAVITIPPAQLKPMHAGVGSQLELDVSDGESVARSVVSSARKRYSLQELLKGSERVGELNASVAWALEGDAVGRELA